MITLRIDMDEKTGKIQVTGPMDNKVLSFGLLEFAKMQIAAFVPSDPKMIQIANGAVAKAMQNGAPKL